MLDAIPVEVQSIEPSTQGKGAWKHRRTITERIAGQSRRAPTRKALPYAINVNLIVAIDPHALDARINAARRASRQPDGRTLPRRIGGQGYTADGDPGLRPDRFGSSYVDRFSQRAGRTFDVGKVVHYINISPAGVSIGLCT